ncbi:MAG: lipase secretion chaperone [Steroidobacter sp.]
MKSRILPIALALTAVVTLLLLFGRDRVGVDATPPMAANEPSDPTRTQSAESPSDVDVQLSRPTVSAEPAADDEMDERIAQTNDEVFRTNSSGKLILNEHTRLNLEALIARTEPAELAEAQQEIAGMLPPAAAAQARELIDRYDNYQRAQRQSYPPGSAPSTEDEALAELEGLHALRVAHFGPDIAAAFYAEEEAISRQLIELMRLEKDQGLTMEEKAIRAQQMRDSMPEIAAIERRNREETPED